MKACFFNNAIHILFYLIKRMASDLKMEIFAFNLFHNLWYTYGVTEILPDVLEVYKDECDRVNDLMEALEIQFDPVIFVRRLVFKNIYREVLTDELIESLKSPLDCCNYVHSICDNNGFFDYPTVFQRMFATITFVLIMSLRMHENGHNIDIVKYGHLFWVLYFDQFTEVFYKNGGWKALQAEAKSYEYLFEFHNTFNKCMFKLMKIKQATANFFLSKHAVLCEEQKHEHPTHFSKLWIRFCIKNIESYIKVPLSYEIFMNFSDGELILQDLKLILVHSRPTSSDVKIEKENHQASIIPTEISLPELCYAPDEETQANDTRVQPITFGLNGINDKVHEKTHALDSRVQPISFEQSRLIDKVPDEFLAVVSNFEKRTGTKCVISEHEVLNLDIPCQNENLEFGKDASPERELTKQTSSLNSTENSTTEQNLLPAVDEKKLSETSTKNSANAADSGHSCKSKSFTNKCEGGMTENVCKENMEERDKIEVTERVTFINKMVENVSPEKVSDSGDSCKSDSFTNKCEDGKTVNTCKENMERQDKIEVTGRVKFINKMVENISTDKVSGLTDSSPKSETVSIDGEKKTIKSQEDLRNEQNDPKMKLFFQMLLVLGDKEETKSVLSKLQNNEEGPENSQKSSKKKKKKNKKKPGK